MPASGCEPMKDIAWQDIQGRPIRCEEKLAALREAMTEVELAARDALDDALLMGCPEKQVREVLLALVSAVKPTVKERKPCA